MMLSESTVMAADLPTTILVLGVGHYDIIRLYYRGDDRISYDELST